MNEQENTLLRILQEQMAPALGCTEPIAVALGVATARKYIAGEIEKITVSVDKNIYKNGARVIIPGTRGKGLNLAAALGAIIGDSSKGMQVLEGITQEATNLAMNYIAENKVEVNLDREKSFLYIYSKVATNKGYAICVIEGEHTNVVYIEANGKIIKGQTPKLEKQANTIPKSYQDIRNYLIRDFKNFADKIEIQKVSFVNNAIEMNFELALKGLEDENNFGYKLKKALVAGHLNPEEDPMAWPVILAMSAVFERMNGRKSSVMTVAGSGNQGLTIIVPLTTIAKLKGIKKEILQRSILFTVLTTVYLKSYTGVLSPVCGAGFIASSALSGGVVYLEGGSMKQIETAIKNTIAANAGMICDGAKTSCALKVSTGVSSALINATLALNGMPSISAGDGVISKSVEETAQNIGYLVNKGMATTDNSILDILIKNNT